MALFNNKSQLKYWLKEAGKRFEFFKNSKKSILMIKRISSSINSFPIELHFKKFKKEDRIIFFMIKFHLKEKAKDTIILTLTIANPNRICINIGEWSNKSALHIKCNVDTHIFNSFDKF